jgi:hypothetical protein
MQTNPHVFRAYISVLNLEISAHASTSCEKWAGLVALLDQFHRRQTYNAQALAPIHNMVKTLRDQTTKRSQQESWAKIAKMLRHPKLVQAWSEVLQSPAYVAAIRLSHLKDLAGYDPTVCFVL